MTPLKKILIICFILLSTQNALSNPIFGEKKHQLMINAGPSFRSSKLENKLKYAYLNLSSPSTFFGFNTRDSLELGYMFGITKYKQVLGGISKELVLGSDKLYFTLGLGLYLKEKRTDRVSSHFTFGERAGIGSRFGNVSLELCARHFSNAGMTSQNAGQNFTGLSIGYNF